MFSSSEEKLLLFLEKPSATCASEFFEQAGTVLNSVRDDLRKYTCKQDSTLSYDDIEDIVSDAMVKGLEILKDQYLNKPVSFPYERKYGISVLGWLCKIVGKPYAGTASGLITNKLKANKNLYEKTVPLDDYDLEDTTTAIHETDFHSGPEKIELMLKFLDEFLGLKEPREKFAFRLTTGLHDHDELTPVTVKKLAQMSGFSHADQNRIKTLFIALFPLAEGTSKKLDQNSIGLLLGVQPRQVRNILNSVKKELREQFAINQIDHS